MDSPTTQRLPSKTAIVTGSSSGLGRAIALAFSASGASVICADLSPHSKQPSNPEDEIPTHELIGERGGKSTFVKCDVGDSESVQELVKRAVGEFGRLDIMVNNAGIALEDGTTPVHETADATFDTTLRINARSVFLGCKYAGQQMINQPPHNPSGDRGWIINTASALGLVGFAGAVAYTASKGAVVQMTKTVALDYAPYGIHCNALCPGFTDTAMIAPVLAREGVTDALGVAHPLKGLGKPEDIGKAAVFLASDDASWVTGVPLSVDGGYVAR